MRTQQQKFLAFAYQTGALKFGQFKLNSGRTSPYFLNTGNFANGSDLGTLSGFYAAIITQRFSTNYMLYGPAYKGIPLATATALSLFADHGCSVPFAFDRKETKDHGERGWVVGAPLQGDVVIVEDVITSGLSVDRAVSAIRSQNARPAAVVIALDRMERSLHDQQSAVQQIQEKHKIEVLPLATFNDLLEFVDNVTELRNLGSQLKEYGDEYVVRIQ